MLLEEFNAVLMPFRGRMFGFAKSLVSRKEDAEDIVQDVYLKLWKRRDQLDEIDHLESYAMRAIKNTALNRMQKDQGRWEALDKADEGALLITPESMIEFKDAKSLIMGLVEKLPERQKVIFKLREVEMYEVDRIAELLETDVNNIRVNLSIARKKMKVAYYKVMNHEI